MDSTKLTLSPQIVLLNHVRSVKIAFLIVLQVLVSRITLKNLIFRRDPSALILGTCSLNEADFNRYGSGGYCDIV